MVSIEDLISITKRDQQLFSRGKFQELLTPSYKTLATPRITCAISHTSNSSSNSLREKDWSSLGIRDKRSIFDPVLKEIRRRLFSLGVEI